MALKPHRCASACSPEVCDEVTDHLFLEDRRAVLRHRVQRDGRPSPDNIADFGVQRAHDGG